MVLTREDVSTGTVWYHRVYGDRQTMVVIRRRENSLLGLLNGKKVTRNIPMFLKTFLPSSYRDEKNQQSKGQRHTAKRG